jgi:Cellulose binding domain/Glycosyl hydrolases family 16
MKLNRHSPTFTKHIRIFQRKFLFSCSLLAMAMIIAFSAFVLLKAPEHAHAASWTLAWSDEFNGASGSGLNTSNWKYDTGQGVWGTGEIENMTNSTANVFQDGNGHLVVKAIRDGSGNWTSGRFESAQGFQPPAGGMMAFESSISLPNVTGAAAQGYWPAFWSLGNTYRTGTAWPTSGEIDVMESINGTNVDYAHFHCGVSSGGPCNEPSGLGGSTSPSNGGILQGNFHTYRMEIAYSTSPQQIRFYLDGNNFTTVNANQVDAATWTKATSAGFFIMYDLAIGGSWPGNPTSSTVSGASMIVDDARVYYSGGTPPTSTPTSVVSTSTPTRTATPITTTPTPTSTVGTGAACKVTYAVSNQWQGGFGANVTVANAGSAAINGWTLKFTFPASGQTVTQGWNATWSQSGQNVTATSMSYNGSLSPGTSTSIGFNGSWTTSNPVPTSFTLNGVTCTNG